MFPNIEAILRSSAFVAISVALGACSASSDGTTESVEGPDTNDTPGSGGSRGMQPSGGMGTPAGGPVAGGTAGGTGGAPSPPSMTANGGGGMPANGGGGSATPQ